MAFLTVFYQLISVSFNIFILVLRARISMIKFLIFADHI